MNVLIVLVLLAIAFVGGLVAMYLFCRKNMKKMADIEQAVKNGSNASEVFTKINGIIKG